MIFQTWGNIACLTVPILIEVLLIYGFFRRRKKATGQAAGCGALLFLPILFCTTFNGLSVAYNNILLARFAPQLHEYPLPPHTTEIGRDSWVSYGGRTIGDPGACKYVASLTLQTTLSEDELRAYYAAAGFHSVDKDWLNIGRRDAPYEFGIEISFYGDGGTAEVWLTDSSYYGAAAQDLRCQIW